MVHYGVRTAVGDVDVSEAGGGGVLVGELVLE